MKLPGRRIVASTCITKTNGHLDSCGYTMLGPDRILYDPYLETVGQAACLKQAEFVQQRQPEIQTFCVKKKS